jgi:hypothetical protein
MKKNYAQLLLLVLVALMALSACGLLQEPEEASSTIEAIPLATQAAGVAATDPATIEAAEPTAAPVEPTAAPTEATPAPEPTVEAAAPTGTALVFTIDQSASQVRFQLDEELRGQRDDRGRYDRSGSRATVGQPGRPEHRRRWASSRSTPAPWPRITTSATGPFRTKYLDTGDFEFITFTPTGIEGLPASATVGEAISFSWWAI